MTIGYGKDAVGGQGGKVYEVTEAADGWGPGTLRWACEQPGPKIVLVTVPEVFLAEPLLPPRAAASRTTLTSEDGSVIWGNVWPAAYGVEPVEDIVIENLRFLGPSTHGPQTIKGSDGDCLTPYRIHGLRIQYCTFAGGHDECLGLQHCGEFTVQRCIFTEAAIPGDGNQQHVEGEHNYAAMSSNCKGNGSWIECLFANCRMRTPLVDGPHTIEIVNCFAYNFEKIASESCRVDNLRVEGCVWKVGPNSRAGTAPGTHQLLRDGPANPVSIRDCLYIRGDFRDVISDPAEIHRLGMPGLKNGFSTLSYGITPEIVPAKDLLTHLDMVCGPEGSRLSMESRAFSDVQNSTGRYGVRYDLPKVPDPLPPRPKDDPVKPPEPPADEPPPPPGLRRVKGTINVDLLVADE